MGWAPRWLRGLLGGGRKAAVTKPAKEKKLWGFGKSFREKDPAPADIAELCDSPQFFSATSRPGSSRRGGAFTPAAKSECSRSLFGGYSDCPNYMANTESFRAKARSQSAPKQRPQQQYEKSGSLRRASAHALAAGPAAAQRSVASLHAMKAYPGSGRLDRLGMPVRY
ncbi:Calmodulin binding protein [Zea mays]|uniref:Calmodulin binding protein n=1 Tax=Zea mays TaxID=4577 RepID=A0A1D6E2G5_MAIZE|nr:Calmodulin binding protein [Zea mays]